MPYQQHSMSSAQYAHLLALQDDVIARQRTAKAQREIAQRQALKAQIDALMLSIAMDKPDLTQHMADLVAQLHSFYGNKQAINTGLQRVLVMAKGYGNARFTYRLRVKWALFMALMRG
ncbi:hypothetical protein [Shewanella xiamenensis]|uniref:hypothetical protein n=1 Tax=Shewanella xiamenensis TaxID=332186 RepID=UPI0008498F18|nr:hypothetical protein [Shewanella xiamenensis]ODR86720.1 hypothetical protein ABT47_16115 [Shewanella xiamenensis]